MKIVSLSIRRGTVPVIMFIILMVMGMFFSTKIKYALMPEITTATIVVTTVYPGSGPNEVEKSVTILIEDAIASMEGIQELRSQSMENLSIVNITLAMDADVNVAIQEATQKVNQIVKDLPRGVYAPSIQKFDLSALPIFIAGVNSNLSEVEFFDLVDDRIRPQLSNLPGVANVNLIGGLEREVKVMIDPVKLETYGLSLLNVTQMISYANMEFPTGKLKSDINEMTIRLSGKLSSIEELRNVVVGGTEDGTIIKLKDVADIYDGIADQEKITRINGMETVGIEISKQKDANAVEVSRLVKEKFIELEDIYAEQDVKFEIADDQSRYTLAAADAVKHDLMLAIILVSVVMVLFLQSLRNSIFVLVAIPASLVSTFTAMYLFGFAFDLISLTSLSLVVGSLVDDAIVVIENIYRHMEMGKKRVQASYDAVKELGMTVTAITLVLVAVFLPIAFVPGIVGDILREYAVTIMVSMMLSLLVSFTLVPWMTSRWAKIYKPKDNLSGKFLMMFEQGIESVNKGTIAAMHWALKHKFITLLLTVILFFGTFALVPAGYIGAEFTPAGDRGSFLLRLEFPHDISLKENDNITRIAEDYLMNQPEVKMIYATAGKKSGVISTSATPYYSEISVNLVSLEDRGVSTSIFARRVKSELDELIIGAKVKTVAVNIMGNENVPLEFYVIGNDLDSVIVYADDVLVALKSIEGTVETELSVEKSNPEYNIIVDRDKMTKLGISMVEVGGTLRTAFAGNKDNKFRKGENEYDINVQLNAADRKSKKDLENIILISHFGQQIKLSQFTTIEESTGPSSLERYNRNPSITVTSQILGVSQSSVQSQFQSILDNIRIPKGTGIATSIRTKLMGDSFTDLSLAFLAAIFFVYLIMVLLYNSWADPFVVLFSIPFALIGAFWALALANQTLNIFSILGIVMLTGLVAKNAILVVDFANELRSNGNDLLTAITEAVRLRFRPIVMTNVSMIIGLFPLALSTGAGAEWKAGIGWSLIGGLTVSMFLSMIIVPVIYYGFKRIQQKMNLVDDENIELLTD